MRMPAWISGKFSGDYGWYKARPMPGQAKIVSITVLGSWANQPLIVSVDHGISQRVLVDHLILWQANC
jgi:hypothetical protein